MKIFLSSTYKDLKEIRRVAINYLKGIMGDTTNATGELVAMEFFDATERTCKEECLHELSMCNLLIGIYADKYGTEDPCGKSMTEIEFDYAVGNNIPILSFVKREVCRDVQQEKFIREKVHGQNKSCANFEGPEDFLTRLNDSLKAYLKDLDGYSVNSLWDQVHDTKEGIEKAIKQEIPGLNLQMLPYASNQTDNALQTIYEAAQMLLQYEDALYKENQILYDYAYDARLWPESIDAAAQKGLCQNVEKNAELILSNSENICKGIPNHTRSILLAVTFLKLKRMQERLVVETWSEELRQEVICVREEYIKAISESYHMD